MGLLLFLRVSSRELVVTRWNPRIVSVFLEASSSSGGCGVGSGFREGQTAVCLRSQPNTVSLLLSVLQARRNRRKILPSALFLFFSSALTRVLFLGWHLSLSLLLCLCHLSSVFFVSPALSPHVFTLDPPQSLSVLSLFCYFPPVNSFHRLSVLKTCINNSRCFNTAVNQRY